MAASPTTPAQPGSDVAKPGTTPADPTSRPVIVGHGTPVAADPMVSAAQSGLPDKKPAATVPVSASGGSTKAKLAPASTAEQVSKDAIKETDKQLAEDENKEKPDSAAETATRLNEIIESGEYTVTIHQKNSGGIGLFLGVVLGIVILAVVVLYVLIDLKVVDVGVQLPFEIFK